MRIARALMLFAFLFYGTTVFVSAEVALSIPYMADNTLYINDTDTFFTFTLVNTVPAQTIAKIVFEVPGEATGVMINHNWTDERIFTLAPSEQKKVSIKIEPNGEMIFPLHYKYVEVKDFSGAFAFDVWLGGSFEVNVGDCDRHCYDWQDSYVNETEDDDPVSNNTNTTKKNTTTSSPSGSPIIIPPYQYNITNITNITPSVVSEPVEEIEIPESVLDQGFLDSLFNEEKQEVKPTIGIIEEVVVELGERRSFAGLLGMIFSLAIIGGLGAYILKNYKKDEIEGYLKGGKE